MSNSLVPIEPRDLTELKGVAQVFAESGLFSDARQMAQAFVKIMAGREMGFGAFASMNNIHIIQNKPVIGAHLMAAKVKEHPRYDYVVTRLDNAGCSITFYEIADGQRIEIGVSEFTSEDAEAAKLLGKDNWKKNPRNMYFARAISNGVRWFAPDVFMQPVYVSEEMGDTDAGNDVVFDVNTGEVIEQKNNAAYCSECGKQVPFDTLDDRGWCYDCVDGPEDISHLSGVDDPRDDRPDPFPTIISCWPQFRTQRATLKTLVSDLVARGMNIGGTVYPVAIEQLGYTDNEHVKAVLNLNSIKDWDKRLEDLLNAVIELSPAWMEAQANG